MKKVRAVLVCCIALLGFSAIASDGNQGGDDTSLLCQLFPLTCGATTNGGNGNGNQPPKPD